MNRYILIFSLPILICVFTSCKNDTTVNFKDDFNAVSDRVWIGENYWAIPMEDWRVNNGRVEFTGEHQNARVNILTHFIETGSGDFSVKADLGLLSGAEASGKGSAGFSVGIKDELDADIKAACYYGKGIKAGVSTEGFLFIGDEQSPLPAAFDYSQFNLEAEGRFNDNANTLTLRVKDNKGSISELSYDLDKDVNGLVALVSNFNEAEEETFWFDNITLAGSKLLARPGNSFGPILWAMHTLSQGTLKLSAQMPPIGAKDNQSVELYFKKESEWELASREKIDDAALVATFKIADWDAAEEVTYKLVYENKGKEHTYEGSIRQEPEGRPLKVAGLTCQHAGGYPYTPLISNLKKHNPDLLYFSGDQLYESNGGYPIKRTPEERAILSYLGKWYMFGWTFGDLMRDRPAICTPDDHDVFQGNLWGEGGDAISMEAWKKKADAQGGYVQTPKMVNVVSKTQCGHLPDPFDSAPLHSGIDVWYTDLVYGKVSFAILSDRMFKSGPEKVDREAEGRIDHIKEPLEKEVLDNPDLELLGERQIKFLKSWVSDWTGSNMKVVLSQTVFANVATHHGQNHMFLHGDMDSGGWPKSKRDQVVEIMRQAFAFHINGDQHLPFVVQYGLDDCRDAGWSFCTPAISTGYPRWFLPDSIGIPVHNRPDHNLPNTGCYEDIFGNKNFVYAVGNPAPVVNFEADNRYERAQKKASGFGMVTFDVNKRTILMEAFRFLADKDHMAEEDQYPGWPLTIKQTDNDGREPVAFLPELKISKPDQLIKIINEKDNKLVHIMRIKESTHKPAVYQQGTYTIEVGEGNDRKILKGIKAVGEGANDVINIDI